MTILESMGTAILSISIAVALVKAVILFVEWDQERKSYWFFVATGLLLFSVVTTVIYFDSNKPEPTCQCVEP